MWGVVTDKGLIQTCLLRNIVIRSGEQFEALL
jgi:hypothetical protein